MKSTGKVKLLEEKILSLKDELNFDGVHTVHVGIAHTRYRHYTVHVGIAHTRYRQYTWE